MVQYGPWAINLWSWTANQKNKKLTSLDFAIGTVLHIIENEHGIIHIMAKILMIDDDPNTTWLLEIVLKKEGYETGAVNNSANALSAALSAKPDLILLDLMMPDIDGLETCTILHLHPELKHIPILVLSALGDVKSKVAAFEAGAKDFISKPVHADELKSRIKMWVNYNGK